MSLSAAPALGATSPCDTRGRVGSPRSPMTTLTQPEPWLRGPVDGFEPLLMPVGHAFIQVREDVEHLVARVPAEHTWERPGGAASIGFHVRHLGGALDRLFTDARGEALSDTQKAAMRAEGDLSSIRRRRSPTWPPTGTRRSSGPSSSFARPPATICGRHGQSGGPGCRRRRSASCSTRPSTARATRGRRSRPPRSWPAPDRSCANRVAVPGFRPRARHDAARAAHALAWPHAHRQVGWRASSMTRA